MTPLERVLERLPTARKVGKGRQAVCPAHDDQNPSLSISEGADGKVLLKCLANCGFESVVQALSLKVSDLFPESTRTTSKVGGRGSNRNATCTLEQLASAKGVSAEFLKSLGIVESATWPGAIDIPYRRADGSLAPRTRRRFGTSSKGSKWSTEIDGEIVPYGLWRLDEARRRGLLLIVEGESDC
jgi:hypothetical protein